MPRISSSSSRARLAAHPPQATRPAKAKLSAPAKPPRAAARATTFSDGKVNFTGFHGSLARARPDSMANHFLNTRPPFSALATNVKRHANGVTSYDITPIGPKFAYQPVGVSHFEVKSADGTPQRFSVVEVKLGPDAKSGAKSAYEGRAYQVYGEGPKGTWAAEVWDDVKAQNALVDAAAGLHNRIVDGKPGRGGFRGLATAAQDAEKKAGGAVKTNAPWPPVQPSDALVKFLSDAKAIPGLTPAARTALLAQLQG